MLYWRSVNERRQKEVAWVWDDPLINKPDKVPDHEKIKSYKNPRILQTYYTKKQTYKHPENPSTVSQERLEGEGELLSLQQNVLTAEDDDYLGDVVHPVLQGSSRELEIVPAHFPTKMCPTLYSK